MAKSIMSAVKADTSKHNKPGGRAKASHAMSKKTRAGNKGTFGKAKNGNQVKSVNTGGNYGPLGY